MTRAESEGWAPVCAAVLSELRSRVDDRMIAATWQIARSLRMPTRKVRMALQILAVSGAVSRHKYSTANNLVWQASETK